MAWPTSIVVPYLRWTEMPVEGASGWSSFTCHIDVPTLQVAAATPHSLLHRVQMFTRSLTTRVLWRLHALLADLCRIAHFSESIAPSRTSEVLSHHSHLMFCCLNFHYSAKTISSLIAHSLRFVIQLVNSPFTLTIRR